MLAHKRGKCTGGSVGATEAAFTLVELLVVIGIIALLIAILMPALSRARKQALQVSCGSNERQQVYAAIAYANDWKEQLPTAVDERTPGFTTVWPLWDRCRLPMVGYDTLTVVSLWQYHSYNPGDNLGLGGWAYVLRDYLKNDKDVMICPDGWYTTDQVFIKQSAPPTWSRYCTDNRGHGYLWLAHRGMTFLKSTGFTCFAGGAVAVPDRPRDVAKTVSGKPELLILSDYNNVQGHASPWGALPALLMGNHHGTDVRGMGRAYQTTPPLEDYPFYDPLNRQSARFDDMPLGTNEARIDARTTWKAFQDWPPITYCPNGAFAHIW